MDKKQNKEDYHDKLRRLMDEYVHQIYDVTAKFPQAEKFGVISQLQRATLSVILNYIEGYARKRKAVLIQFLEISYGSLQESIYLVDFSYKRKWMNENERKTLLLKAEEIARMLWGTISKIK